MRRMGSRVNSISPGSISTPMLAYAAKKFSPELPVGEVFERFGHAHPLDRVGTAEEVAELAAFLALRPRELLYGRRLSGGRRAESWDWSEVRNRSTSQNAKGNLPLSMCLAVSISTATLCAGARRGAGGDVSCGVHADVAVSRCGFDRRQRNGAVETWA